MLKLEPGRELDALVATKVMGWERIEEHWEFPGCPAFRFKNNHDIVSCQGSRFDLTRYSTDISKAWEVVEKVCEGGRRVEISTEGRDTTVSLLWAQKETGEIGLLFGVRGRTVPHAICLAALKAVGYTDNEV